MIIEFILLFIAGTVAGVLNTIAGGGSFITFPALIFAGIPPLMANATNTFASCAGYISGAYAFRKQLQNHKQEVIFAIFISILGGAIGAYWLLNMSESSFQKAIPWLLLFATLLFIFGAKANSLLKFHTKNYKYAAQFQLLIMHLFLLIICVYGGFFNAGLGIIVLSYLTFRGHTNINVMNGIKLVVSSAVSLIAILLFILSNSIAWFEGSIVLVGTLLGGYFSAHISMKLSQQHVRTFVILTSCVITGYFFYTTYR